MTLRMLKVSNGEQFPKEPLKYLKIIPRPNSKISFIKNKFVESISKNFWITQITEFINLNVLNGPSNVYNLLYNLSRLSSLGLINFLISKLSN